MKTVSAETSKKIGLFSAISMLIGSIIGIGIFFKNGNVFAVNNFNGYAILTAWIISGLISVAAAFSFAEVGSSTNSRSGLGGWCTKLVGQGFGKFVKVVQPIFYFGVLSFSISMFSAEALFNIFNYSDKVHFSVIMIIGFSFFVLFLIFNYISLKASAKLSVIITSIKFIPLILVIIFGLIYGVKNPNYNLFTESGFNFVNGGKESPTGVFSFASVLISIPSILFAFDPFFGAGSLSKEMINPKRNVPLTVIISMLTVTGFYLLITIAQILSGQGSAYGLFETFFNGNYEAQKAFQILISIFIFIAIMGVLNSFSALIIRSFQSLIDSKLLFKGTSFSNAVHKNIARSHYNEFKPGAILALIIFSIIFIIILIPSSVTNSDAFVDGISNFPITIFFGIYGIVILAGFINRFTNKVDVIKVKGFMFVAPLAVLGCFLVSGFQIFYTFSIGVFLDPTGHGLMSWGLFSTNGLRIENWLGSVCFFVYVILMLSFFFGNNYLNNKFPSGNTALRGEENK
ncbi:MAG: APC family permease [Mycoplasma sp.]